MYVKRFVERMNLPSALRFQLKDAKTNMIGFQEFEARREGRPVLELYHAVRNPDDVGSILQHGFIVSGRGNKGHGVYLSNHGRYAAFCMGSDKPVIVCHVISDETKIQRYRSEIESEKPYDSEYVVSDANLVYPKHVIMYDLEMVDRRGVKEYFRKNPSAFVRWGSSGCPHCDHVPKRCDCPQFPIVQKSDIA